MIPKISETTPLAYVEKLRAAGKGVGGILKDHNHTTATAEDFRKLNAAIEDFLKALVYCDGSTHLSAGFAPSESLINNEATQTAMAKMQAA